MLAVLGGGVSVADELHTCTCLGCGASEFACRFATESFFHGSGAVGDVGNSGDSDRSVVDFGPRHLQKNGDSDDGVSRCGMMVLLIICPLAFGARNAYFGEDFITAQSGRK